MSVTKEAGQRFLGSLGEKDITPFNLPGVDDKNLASQSLHNARENGQWVMNDDESGYNLLIPSSIHPGEWQMLQTSDGAPLTLKRDDVLSGRYISPYDYQEQRDVQLAREGKRRYIGGEGG